MKIVLTLTAYDRPELLKIALENLIVKYPSGADEIHVVVDRGVGEGCEPEINKIISYYGEKFCSLNTAGDFRSTTLDKNYGVAIATNVSLNIDEDYDVFVHVDSDTYIEKAGWARKLADFLINNPEVGLAAPDLPGRYMRIKRRGRFMPKDNDGYNEIEYALGMIWACRKEVVSKVRSSNALGVFDENIHHQFDPDLCIRIRMLGYRVGIINIGKLVDLGVGTGDSSRSESVQRGGFEFLKKWNEYFLGYFHYKSPGSLTWPTFPPNFVWRRLWLSQFFENEKIPQVKLQDHLFDIVNFPWDAGKWNLEGTRKHLEKDVVLSGTDEFEKVDKELLAGKRQWETRDVQ